MDFKDVYLVSQNLQTVEQSRLDELEAWLKHPLPLGYREFMSQLGVGEYCHFYRVYLPEEIPKAQAGFRDTIIDGYYERFFEGQQDVLSTKDALSSVVFADTIDGDYIVYAPNTEHQLYVLPRHSQYVYWVENGFFSMHRWRYRQELFDESQVPSVLSFYSDLPRHNRRLTLEHTADFTWLIQQSHGYWNETKIRFLENDGYSVIYVRTIEGFIGFYDFGERKFDVNIYFDDNFVIKINEFVQWLISLDFKIVRDEIRILGS